MTWFKLSKIYSKYKIAIQILYFVSLFILSIICNVKNAPVIIVTIMMFFASVVPYFYKRIKNSN